MRLWRNVASVAQKVSAGTPQESQCGASPGYQSQGIGAASLALRHPVTQACILSFLQLTDACRHRCRIKYCTMLVVIKAGESCRAKCD